MTKDDRRPKANKSTRKSTEFELLHKLQLRSLLLLQKQKKNEKVQTSTKAPKATINNHKDYSLETRSQTKIFADLISDTDWKSELREN